MPPRGGSDKFQGQEAEDSACRPRISPDLKEGWSFLSGLCWLFTAHLCSRPCLNFRSSEKVLSLGFKDKGFTGEVISGFCNNLGGGYHPHFTDEKMEAQRVWVNRYQYYPWTLDRFLNCIFLKALFSQPVGMCKFISKSRNTHGKKYNTPSSTMVAQLSKLTLNIGEGVEERLPPTPDGRLYWHRLLRIHQKPSICVLCNSEICL